MELKKSKLIKIIKETIKEYVDEKNVFTVNDENEIGEKRKAVPPRILDMLRNKKI